VSATFFLIGMIPDIAAARDATTVPWRKKLYTVLAFGWRGTDTRVAALHEGVPLPRRARHAAGAVRALGRVVGLRHVDRARLAHHDLRTLLRGRRHLLRPGDGDHAGRPDPQDLRAGGVLHAAHFDAMAKLVLVTGMVVFYAYLTEFFMAWYSFEVPERADLLEPRVRRLLVGDVDHAHLQRHHPDAAVVAKVRRTSRRCS
jgi:hypothetical protein